MKVTAEIKYYIGDGLYVIVDGDDATAWPVKENEIEAIRDACNKYLQNEETEIRK